MSEPTGIHGPSPAREPSNYVAHCRVCHTQWQVRGDSDEEGCSFCDAPASAIWLEYEGPTAGPSAHEWASRKR